MHHVRPLAEVNEEYEIDPMKDLVPLCPNCHLAVHTSKDRDIVAILKKRMTLNNSRARR